MVDFLFVVVLHLWGFSSTISVNILFCCSYILFRLFSFVAGKSFTMIGQDQSPQTMGVIPCSIAWLYRLINEEKEKTGARFSVRVSVVEVTGKQEILRDLLVNVGNCKYMY